MAEAGSSWARPCEEDQLGLRAEVCSGKLGLAGSSGWKELGVCKGWCLEQRSTLLVRLRKQGSEPEVRNREVGDRFLFFGRGIWGIGGARNFNAKRLRSQGHSVRWQVPSSTMSHAKDS